MASKTLSPIAPSAPSNQAGAAPFDDGADAGRTRRRLGNWQSSPVGGETQDADHAALDIAVEPEAVETPVLPAAVRFGQRRHAQETIAPVREAPVAADPPPPIVDQPSRLEALVQAITAGPNDVAALTELSHVLHDRGMVQESRDIQTRLAALQTNSHRSANAQTAVRVPEAKLGTEPLGRATRTRRSTTSTLRSTTLLTTKLTSFPLDELGFTIPLPDEEELPIEAREPVEQSGYELANGQLMAAFDSCVTAIERAPDYTPIHLRIAEIHARQRSARRARTHAEAIVRLGEVSGKRDNLWMARRVLLHASESDLDALTALVDALIEANRPEEAERYGAKLIETLVGLGQAENALSVSDRLCALAPGDERIALGNVELLAKTGDFERASDRWEQAVSGGADPHVAKASMAALIGTEHELDHWRLLGDAIEGMRATGNTAIARAYVRTADALAATPLHAAGRAIALNVLSEPPADSAVIATMTDQFASEDARALAAVAIAQDLDSPERLNALRVAIAALQTPSDLEDAVWIALVGAAPKVEDLEADLGDTLRAQGDAAGAVEVLKRAQTRDPQNAMTTQLLADAHVANGQLGAALAVLDQLAINQRTAGRLEEMAAVLRKMSSLAPKNIKVKTRLIDAYLQRGFVEEAGAELLARADLEERNGRNRDAAASLQRSADLSWGLGKHEESYATYQRLIALAPDDAGNRSSLVNLYLQEGRILEAAEHQRAVVNISVRTGSRHEAIAALHQVIGLTPDDCSAYYQLGDLLNEMGEHHQAEKVFRRLSLMSPSDDVAREKAAEMALLK